MATPMMLRVGQGMHGGGRNEAKISFTQIIPWIRHLRGGLLASYAYLRRGECPGDSVESVMEMGGWMVFGTGVGERNFAMGGSWGHLRGWTRRDTGSSLRGLGYLHGGLRWRAFRWAVRSWVVIDVGGLIGTFSWCLEIWTWGIGDSPISRSRLETFTRCRCHIGTWDFASDLLESR